MLIQPLSQKILNLTSTAHLPPHWLTERPHLFSNSILHLPVAQAESIKDTIRTIEHIAALPAFQTAALSPTAPLSPYKPANPGVLLGYDFHLSPEGPKLIEINTNAGGAFFMALLEAAWNVPDALTTWQSHFMAMFLAEWRSKQSDQPLRTIAIVDKEPQQQYFYPEFLLFQALFQAHHIQCLIVDPADLSIRENKLWVDDIAIDLVYNRLTDFDLSQPAHTILQTAYQENIAVVTPHPYAHALYANKRNLTLLSEVNFLIACGLAEKTAQALQTVIPTAYMVDAAHAENLWHARKQLFFKPISGHGGKGVYRGYNITKRVFAHILAGDYMAQKFIPPSEMAVNAQRRKVDLRAYVYQDEILGFGARLYQGQTTNFRTEGGGFTVVKISED
jgi:glutathione synthase/RimK-type ligase-like ATP-grasp enzyme